MSLKPSTYSTIEIVSPDGRTADVRLATVGIDYYEDILCPTVSLKLQIADAGGSIKSADGGETLSLYDGMKLRGGERMLLRIEPNSGTNIPLDFSQRALYIRGIKNVIRDGDKEVFEIHLISQEAAENEVTFLKKLYPEGKRISDHVEDIINESFTDPGEVDVDPTTNPLGFQGNQEHPFKMITSLASKSVSGEGLNGSAGFFFFQTAKGFSFKSIDSLISVGAVAEYFYTERNYARMTFQPSPDLPSLDQKIVRYEILQNQDIISNLKKGAYSSEKRFFDPTNFLVTTPKRGGSAFGVEKYFEVAKNLGAAFSPETLKLVGSAIDIMGTPSKIITQNIDKGTNSKGEVTQKENQEIEKIYSQRAMRYNTLFTQSMSITVPLNSNITAGSIIKVNIPQITPDSRIGNETEQISGLYMVKELCHHYDPYGSWTAMKVIRDTYGSIKPNV